jgi:hypothetical protein
MLVGIAKAKAEGRALLGCAPSTFLDKVFTDCLLALGIERMIVGFRQLS